MDEINIEGVILTPLNRIFHPKGDVFHGMKKSDEGFTGFGEAYFSIIKNGEIKGWKKHKKMTMNLIVPVGIVSFVLYDDRKSSSSRNKFYSVTFSQDNFQRLTVPSGIWYAFKGNSNDLNLILDVADLEHDPHEIVKLHLDEIYFDWESM